MIKKDPVAEIAKRMAKTQSIQAEINDLSNEAGEIDLRRETWADFPDAIEHQRLAEIGERLAELKGERDELLLEVERLSLSKK